MLSQEYFISLARPKQADFLRTMSQKEQATMQEHFVYARRLFDEGKLLIGGAFTDGAFGMLVYRAASEQEAREMFSNDPLVKAGISDGEFHPFRVVHSARER
jgi:uncharacterized protein YciI